MPRPTLPAALALALAALLAPGCGERADVVLYCAVDKEHSEPIVRAFEEATGLEVDFHPDVEASKSVGHRRRLMEERNNPRCDVFWNNEVVQMAMLAENGLLQPYVSPAAADIPERYKDADDLWTGFGARARILIVNTEAFPDPDARPDATADLNAIVHPEVRRALLAGLAEAGDTPVVLDVPLLLEAGPLAERVDVWVFVEAPEEAREARAAARGWDPGERARREARQADLQAKRRRAGHRLENRGTIEDLGRQVDGLLSELGID